MLFFIENEVGLHFDSGAADARDVDAFNYLAMGVSEGSHRFAGSRQTLAIMSQHNDLTTKSRSACQRALGRFTLEANLYKNLLVYAKVGLNSFAHPVSQSVGTQRVINFPLQWFDRSEKIQPTIVLGEDLSDSHVIKLMAEAGTVIARYPYLPISAELEPGGGSRIPIVMSQKIQRDRLCFCVVDSDKACPSSIFGGTAKSMQKFKDSATYPLVSVIETEGRDLENSLPNFFFNRTGTSVDRSISNLFVHLTSIGEIEARSHVDVSEGICGHDFFSQKSGTDEEIFWQSKMKSVCGTPGAPINSACLSSLSCDGKKQGGPCVCVFGIGLGKRVLDNFWQYYNQGTRFDLANSLDEAVIAHWKNIGPLAASWCCGDDLIRV